MAADLVIPDTVKWRLTLGESRCGPVEADVGQSLHCPVGADVGQSRYFPVGADVGLSRYYPLVDPLSAIVVLRVEQIPKITFLLNGCSIRLPSSGTLRYIAE